MTPCEERARDHTTCSEVLQPVGRPAAFGCGPERTTCGYNRTSGEAGSRKGRRIGAPRHDLGAPLRRRSEGGDFPESAALDGHTGQARLRTHGGWMNYSRDDVSAAIAAMEKFRRPDDDSEIGAALVVVGLSAERAEREARIRDDLIRVAYDSGASLRQLAEVSGLGR